MEKKIIFTDAKTEMIEYLTNLSMDNVEEIRTVMQQYFTILTALSCLPDDREEVAVAISGASPKTESTASLVGQYHSQTHTLISEEGTTIHVPKAVENEMKLNDGDRLIATRVNRSVGRPKYAFALLQDKVAENHLKPTVSHTDSSSEKPVIVVIGGLAHNRTEVEDQIRSAGYKCIWLEGFEGATRMRKAISKANKVVVLTKAVAPNAIRTLRDLSTQIDFTPTEIHSNNANEIMAAL